MYKSFCTALRKGTERKGMGFRSSWNRSARIRHGGIWIRAGLRLILWKNRVNSSAGGGPPGRGVRRQNRSVVFQCHVRENPGSPCYASAFASPFAAIPIWGDKEHAPIYDAKGTALDLHFSASQLKSRVSPCFFIFDFFFDHQHILSKLDKFSVYFFLLKY